MIQNTRLNRKDKYEIDQLQPLIFFKHQVFEIALVTGHYNPFPQKISSIEDNVNAFICTWCENSKVLESIIIS